MMKQIGLGRFLLLVLVVSLGVGLVMLKGRPSPYAARLQVKRLTLLQANLRRAGVMTPKKEKRVAAELASWKEWGY